MFLLKPDFTLVVIYYLTIFLVVMTTVVLLIIVALDIYIFLLINIEKLL